MALVIIIRFADLSLSKLFLLTYYKNLLNFQVEIICPSLASSSMVSELLKGIF